MSLPGAPVPEREWWVQLGADAQARQHLAAPTYASLVRQLRLATGRAQAWASFSVIVLGLFDEAWAVQQALPDWGRIFER